MTTTDLDNARTRRRRRLLQRYALIAAVLFPLPRVEADSLTSGPEAPRPVSVDELNTTEINSPKGSDPLTPSEMNRAKGHAEQSGRVLRARNGGQSRRWPRALQQSLERVQYLYTERHPTEKDTGRNSRLADVFYYDYNKDEVLRQVVDLRNGEVMESQSGRPETPPPVTRKESLAGLQLIFDHPQLGPSLKSLYREVSGQDLTKVEQLRAQSGLVSAPPAGSPLATIAAICGQHRCLQYLLPYDDQRFIDASNLVVDLSAGQVLWVDQGLNAHVDADLPDTQAVAP